MRRDENIYGQLPALEVKFLWDKHEEWKESGMNHLWKSNRITVRGWQDETRKWPLGGHFKLQKVSDLRPKNKALDWKKLFSTFHLGSNLKCYDRFLGVLGVHWKDWCWSWNSSTLATWCEELTHFKRPWCWERLRAGGEGDDRGWDGITETPLKLGTQSLPLRSPSVSQHSSR